MTSRTRPLLHRDDPAKAPLVGHVKVTKRDWLNMARDVLVNEGAGEIKILGLARRMGVSRSSFYWYFKDRADLQDALLDEWEARNTAQIVAQCALPAATISEALCHFFTCFVDPAKFDSGLDFAIREWSRRDADLRERVERADATRLEAVVAAFDAHGYPPQEADARARIVYYMQLGYHALDVGESMEVRMSRVAEYLRGFTGRAPDEDAVARFARAVLELERR